MTFLPPSLHPKYSPCWLSSHRGLQGVEHTWWKVYGVTASKNLGASARGEGAHTVKHFKRGGHASDNVHYMAVVSLPSHAVHSPLESA